jgi:hypothetical protein
MWTWNASRLGSYGGRKEEDLARYFEVEYGEEEVARLLAQARELRAPFIGRVWSRLRVRLARRNNDKVDGTFCLLPGPQDLHRCS